MSKPIKFDYKCPKCPNMGEVARNNDGILWFSCSWCGLQRFWKGMSKQFPANTSKDTSKEDMNYEAIAEKYF